MVGVLRAEALRKAFRGKTVVDRVSLSLKAGEVVGLLGPNGAGKTTTFSLILGFLRPDSGRVFLNGEDITTLPVHERARRGLGFLPQEPSVFRKLTVEENILAVLEIKGIRRQERKHRLEELLEELGLSSLAKAKAYTLSGGERRRVELARALASSPTFLLLDEPFIGIDPIALAEIQGMMKRLKERGIGLLVTDHNVRETLKVVDRAYLIWNGGILLEGTAEGLASDERARAVYLGRHFTL